MTCPHGWIPPTQCPECKDAELERLQADNARLRAALNAARRYHVGCDDPWYSCPKHSEGCANDAEGPECNCGADEHNAAIDAALQYQQTGGDK